MLEPIFPAASGQPFENKLVLQIIHSSYTLASFKLFCRREGPAPAGISSRDGSSFILREFYPITVGDLPLQHTMDGDKNVTNRDRCCVRRRRRRDTEIIRAICIIPLRLENYRPIGEHIAGDLHPGDSRVGSLLAKLIRTQGSPRSLPNPIDALRIEGMKRQIEIEKDLLCRFPIQKGMELGRRWSRHRRMGINHPRRHAHPRGRSPDAAIRETSVWNVA